MSQNLKSWPKGVSGNPGGRPRVIPEELRNIKPFTSAEVTRIISKYGRMTFDELLKSAQTNLPSMDLAVISVLRESIEKADHQRLSFLLDRTIGKVPVIVEDEEENSERAELAKLPIREIIKLVMAEGEN